MELIKDLGMITKGKRKRRYGLYLCKCGNTHKARIYSVESGATKTCGCSVKKHGKSSSRLYQIWGGIISRCDGGIGLYGEKSIQVCEEWRSFIAFNAWAEGNGYTDTLSIDRINNDGNYEPCNCRWTTREVQNRNTRKISKNNTSGFRGVDKRYRRWGARICVEGKSIRLGSYGTKQEAANAYDEYVTKNNLEHTKNFS